jgi:glycosyltransferase involved in cell wall biosynthesis
MKVVANGFDTERFRPEPARGLAQRKVWGIPEGVPLIGIAGRLDPVKDHPTFLRMAARLRHSQGDVWFVCMGDGGSDYLKFLQSMATSLGIGDRVKWPGVCLDMPSAYNALSLLALTSTDEGFPNVLGEAMACGIPCLSTPAGDAARLIGDTGRLCSFGDDAALAEAAASLLSEPPEARAARARICRDRVVTAFSIEALVRETETALLEVMPKAPPLRPPVDGPEPGKGPAAANSTYHTSRG